MSGFKYLATPYSKYPDGVDAAHAEACAIAAALFRQGTPVYSPIAHTHAIETIGRLGVGFEHWAAFDEAMIAASDGMIVAMMDGWKDSAGIAAEIVICRRLGKPVEYLDPTAVQPTRPPADAISSRISVVSAGFSSA